ncbi:MAG: DNA adenine methylase, partial [Gammaproteobacteria bacterium]
RYPREVSCLLKNFRRNKREYYRVRRNDVSGLTAKEKAARFIFLNRYCFNGIYRTNLRGEFNVPYSPSRTGDLPTAEELTTCSRILKAAKLIGGDFERCLIDVGKGDFVYLDPPYTVSSRRIFREYGPRPFDDNDLERLAKSLQIIHDSGAHFVLSYAYSPEGLKWFRRWNPRKIRTVRNMAGFTSTKKFAFEIVATNIEGGK